MIRVLEGLFEVDNPLVLGFDKHISFGLDVFDLILLVHLVFLHLLHGNYLAILTTAANSHLPKSPPSNDGERIEIFYSNFFAPKPQINFVKLPLWVLTLCG